MEQQQQGQGAPGDNRDGAPSAPPVQQGNDDTWGLGSASALDSLRRQNFRGHRAPGEDERPASK